MTYAFNLEFYELDEELQQQKIDEVIAYLEKEEGDEYKQMSYEEQVEDAKRFIEAHFPIYF